ncbi:family 10 glycosylhydrolase [Acholeplasma equirhinis]|uniref:glycoside hydrolase family 10 protein n=1 Tax=Acholeplasma equirhinis TaxID=555393 RepID=UPI00197AA356|nr:family 10 glycosylhydrolase [Acholeplasma equirhinis]MBN3490778.1 family 10 glycosylhydrolase [Acholeplasma equirhinis]
MKLFNFKTGLPLNYFQTDRQVEIPETFNQKEVRAFWVSNVVNIDLPPATNPEYKAKVLEMFDTAVNFNINTIFFQVRTTSDAFYKSKLNPYSRYLVEKEGQEPPFDILDFVLDEAKKRNIEIHAWCNPYRVSMQKDLTKAQYLETCDDLNFAKQHPEFVIVDKNGGLILNPAKKEVKDFIIESMLEILENYKDIAGIHFDDYFYPYAGLSESDNDLADYEASGKKVSLDQFRRDQITEVIKRLNEEIKSKFSGKRFGVSPFGIWKNQASDPAGSNTDPKCSESYSNQYADSVLWIKEGYIDYIIPQLYWDFGHVLAPFADLAVWWADIVKGTNCDLYIGHGAYRLGSEGGYENPLEVVNQLKFANQFETVKGNVFFTYKTFIDQAGSKAGMELVQKLLNERKG